MLLLNRKPGSSVIITNDKGDEIIVTLISYTKSEGAKLGFRADQKWRIVREEINKKN